MPEQEVTIKNNKYITASDTFSVFFVHVSDVNIAIVVFGYAMDCLERGPMTVPTMQPMPIPAQMAPASAREAVR